MKVGFIGLGTMGRSMALNLMRHRHELTVYARRAAALETLVTRGAQSARTPAELATGCDAIFTMVTAASDVEQVLVGDNGVIHGARPGTVVIDSSTIDPTAARSIGETLGGFDIELLDAPVSGGPQGAQEATLSIMVGGKPDVLERVRPLLDCVGRTVRYMGEQGAGQTTKACH